MTQGGQPACPVMARSAGLHTDQARRKLAEEGHHLSPPEQSAGKDFSCPTDRVHLKGILRQVNADSRDLHLGASKFGLRDSTTVALRRREREPSTPSALGRSEAALYGRLGA